MVFIRLRRYKLNWLLNHLGLDKLRASEPASHASHHVSHERQMLVPSPFSFLRLLAAFGYLARVFAILALLSISFCYLPSSFSSFVKVNYVICYYFSRVLNR